MNPEETHTISHVGGSTAPEHDSKVSAPPVIGYNMRCPAVKRLMREAAELANPENDYSAQPTEANLFEWHFTIRGPEGSEFESGYYHGRIIFPTEYPMKPPSFILLTPNGRFQTEEKICLSISNYHPETWLPSWSIEKALVALRSFMTTPGNEGAIGSLNFPVEERKKLAVKSQNWSCHECGPIVKLLPSKIEDGLSSSAKDRGDGGPVSTAKITQNTATPLKTTGDKDSNGVTQAEDSENQTVTSEISTDNPRSTSALNAETATLDSATEPQQQQNESIKNIIYDFGIGCFVILILALCLRRLLTIFLRL